MARVPTHTKKEKGRAETLFQCLPTLPKRGNRVGAWNMVAAACRSQGEREWIGGGA